MSLIEVSSIVDFIGSFNPRPPKRTLCPNPPVPVYSRFVVSIHVLRRGRCVYLPVGLLVLPKKFQSTSSEEDVVSVQSAENRHQTKCFNPRPPKRTLCLSAWRSITHSKPVSIHVLRRGRCVHYGNVTYYALDTVSIHVLRRGRCVIGYAGDPPAAVGFNPRPPKRTLCHVWR